MTIAHSLAECQTSYKPYLQTVAYCLKSRCSAEPRHEAEGYWTWLQDERGSIWPRLTDILPQTPPPLAPLDMKELKYTVQVCDTAYEYGLQKSQANSWNERWNERMA